MFRVDLRSMRLMVTYLLLLIVANGASRLSQAEQPQIEKLERFEYRSFSMGSNLDIILYAMDERSAVLAIGAALEILEHHSVPINNYDPASEVSRLQSVSAGERLRISSDLSFCIQRARAWHQWSEGAFDATQSELFRLWSKARKTGIKPTETEVMTTQERAGWDEISVERVADDEVFLSHRGPKLSIDLGGLAVGRLIDLMMESLKESGIQSAMIDAGGDIIVSAPPPGKSGWTIDVAGLNADAPSVGRLTLKDCAVTTSGDLNQASVIDSVRYSHIVDPRELGPVTQRRSVTVVAKTGLDADAGATALAALGPIDSMRLVNQMPLEQVWYMYLGEEDVVPRLRFWER